jgi:hypothetical protein
MAVSKGVEMTQFRANLVQCLHNSQRKKNVMLARAWSMALKAYDAKNVDSLNFWLRMGAYELPNMRQRALTVAPITLEGLIAYEKEQLGNEQTMGVQSRLAPVQ